MASSTEPKVIKDFPGRAVEAYRNRHGGALPGELQPCAHCGFDEASYSKEKHLHIVVCLHCGSRSPATSTQDGARTVWNARAPAKSRKERLDDSNRLEWLCEKLDQCSLYFRKYEQAHELPRGGYALYNNSFLLGFGECMADAIDDAIRREG